MYLFLAMIARICFCSSASCLRCSFCRRFRCGDVPNNQPKIPIILFAGFNLQGGRRKGAIAVYTEPWHPDVFEFLDMRRNQGEEHLRAREL